MIAVLSRILARYVAGAFAAYGLLPHDLAQEIALDPDVAFAIAALLTVATEGAYALARRAGWAT